MSTLSQTGIKSIKIALAVIMSLFVGNLFRLDSPYLLAITAIIGIQATVYDAVANARERVIGTSIGVIVGLIVITLLPNDFLVISIGLFLIIYACNILNLKNSIIQASVIYLSIMLFPSPNNNAISITISTTSGVIVSIIVNFIFAPFELRDTLYSSYIDLIEHITSLCEKLFTTFTYIDLNPLNSKIIAYKSLVKAYDNEYFKIKDKRLSLDEINALSENLSKISFYMYGSSQLRENQLNKYNVEKINQLLNLNLTVSNSVKDKKDILFNFHVSKLLSYLDNLL